MKSLIDYLNNTQQYESILDPNQDQVMDRMTDEMIRRRIQEYCTYDDQKYRRGELWDAARSGVKIITVDKDKQGWYVETECSTVMITSIKWSKSYYDGCSSYGYKIDKQKGFLIEDIGVYFRWRKHKGRIEIWDAPYFESTVGLPEELECLYLSFSCQKSKKLDVRNKINVISLRNINDLRISGNGCKNILIDPATPGNNIEVPSGTKIYRPKDSNEYFSLRDKLSEY